jgi:DNA invertase Pin-like site-specific DNA recombinase
MKVFYSRVSSTDGSQNPARQLQNIKDFDYVLTDYCSGSIPLYERPQGSQIKQLIEKSRITYLEIHSIDRLGRDLLSTLNVWEELTKLGITIVCRNPNIRNIDENGKVDYFSQLMMSMLATMSSFEKSLIRERQLEGIKIRKQKGLYGGRRIGTIDTPERFLKRDKNKKIIEYLKKGYSYADISRIIPCSATTIVKVKKTAQIVLKELPA